MIDQITARELADRLEEGGRFTLVDTREEDSFDQWHVHGAANVPFDPDEGFGDEHLRQVEAAVDGDPIVAICGKGLTSTPFALNLEDEGYDGVSVVRGGMEEWATVHEHVDVADGDLLVRQIQRPATGCLGYVVGSRSSGEAVVVDPTRQTDEFAVAAQELGLDVTAVVDTHVHADHVSGGPGLAERLDVPYRLGIDVDDPTVEHDYESLDDGERIDLGGVEVRALHTPGHTMDMANLLVDDEYLLSGDTLFVDSVGRTELSFGEEGAERGAELLYESLHETLLELDDDLTVLPGHVSVTADNRYESGSRGEPIRARLGDLRTDLDLLGLDREAFVDRITDDLPEKPSSYETIIAINAGERSVETEEDAAELETGPNSCAA
ncbi:MBL fold metallo-hydrolase [Natronoarchaeum rubrum]|uniref:MBL fold metallo-hydrolase n=1 Tax=Natronoarchaeum rubrum TaxID=755311 RepID=UPI0021121FE0|nr:MBL fold metallo-hydrolase [Natronoarchaeum rubrum]